jgi:hypothetical protein
MGKIEILSLCALLNQAERRNVFSCSIQISYLSRKLFLNQVKNGLDYWSRTTLKQSLMTISLEKY